MKVLKYIDKNGKEQSVGVMKVMPTEVLPTTGDSETAAMSQKAVTEELNKLDEKMSNIEIPEVNEKFEDLENSIYQELNAGDVILVNKTTLEKAASSPKELFKYSKEDWEPIGVVVIPSNHNVYGTGEAAMIPLLAASLATPDTGDYSTVDGIYYGPSSNVEGIDNYDAVVNLGTMNNSLPKDTVQGTSSSGYIPLMDQRMNKKCECPTDPGTYYWNTSNSSMAYIPSPYLLDGSRNPQYYTTDSPSSPSNALSDFNGKRNTEILCNKATAQPNWRTDEIIQNKYTTGYYPAACCCWRFHTLGTEQGDWYLPAAGELGYISVRSSYIYSVIDTVSSHFNKSVFQLLATGNNYMSSTPYNSSKIMIFKFRDAGDVTSIDKNSSSLKIKPFARIKIEKPNNYKFYTKEEIDEKLYDYDANGHDYVDMGPAGIWATCNVGTNNPLEGGLYFMWGETQGYTKDYVLEHPKNFYPTNYKFNGDKASGTSEQNMKLTKYVPNYAPSKYAYEGDCDNLTELELEDDAAHINMGGSWRMPSANDFSKLWRFCNTEYTKSYKGSGVGGRIFRLKSDPTKELFIIGQCGWNSNWGTAPKFSGEWGQWGHVWTRSLSAINSSYNEPTNAMVGAIESTKAYDCEQQQRCTIHGIRAILDTSLRKEKYISKKEVSETFATKDDLENIEIPEVDLSDIEAKLEGVTKAADDSHVLKEIFLNNDDIEIFPHNGTITINGFDGIKIGSTVNDRTIDIQADTDYLATKSSVDSLKQSLNLLIDGETANDAFDTLKEVDTWIKSHETEAADLVQDVIANKAKLDKIEVEKLYTSDNLDVSEFATKQQLQEENEQLKAQIQDLQSKIDDLYRIVTP